MSVTVYSPCFNQASSIAQHVASIRAQTVPVERIVTVRDGGDDAAWQIAEREGVVVLDSHAGQNLGLAASCNTALKHCTTEFLAKVDSDVVLAPFWLEKCLPHFGNPFISGVGGPMMETGCDLATRWRAVFMRQHWGVETKKAPLWLYGADCIFRVEALRRVGGWNPKYRKNFEDTDLSSRLGRDSLVYEAGALAKHLLRCRFPGVLTHYWNWAHDPNDVGYGSIAEAAGLIAGNYAKAMAHCKFCLEQCQPELLYPCWLLFWWLCLKDLEHVERLTGISTAATTTSVCRYIYDCPARMALSLGAVNRISKDIIKTGKIRFTSGVADVAYLTEFRRHALPCDSRMAWLLEASIETLET